MPYTYLPRLPATAAAPAVLYLHHLLPAILFCTTAAAAYYYVSTCRFTLPLPVREGEASTDDCRHLPVSTAAPRYRFFLPVLHLPSLWDVVILVCLGSGYVLLF